MQVLADGSEGWFHQVAYPSNQNCLLRLHIACGPTPTVPDTAYLWLLLLARGQVIVVSTAAVAAKAGADWDRCHGNANNAKDIDR